MVGRNPVLEENRKIVYALQEDGTAVPLAQPVIGSAGGVPVYNGSPVSLAVSGSYSLTILDSSGVEKYVIPHVASFNLQGLSGVVAEESQTVAASLILTFSEIEATTSSFYQSVDASGTSFKGSFLKKGVDYLVISETQIQLLNATADDVVILGRQMDPTGQIVPVTEGSSALFVFEDIAIAVAADLQDGDTVTINGGIVAGDKLGGNKYLTVLGQPDTPDGENIINLTNGNQIKVIENNFVLARYSEVTTINTSVAGALNLDLNEGNVHRVTLTENVSVINFLNVNPDTTLTTTVTLKVTQNGVAPFTVNFAGINWAGATPIMTATLDAVDRYGFIIDSDGIDGFVTGQVF